MKILFISSDGNCLGLVMRCDAEEHLTSLYIENRSNAMVGNCMVDKPVFSKFLTNNAGDVIPSAVNQLVKESDPELVVVLGTRLGKVADYIKKECKLPVVGASHFTDTLSSSPTYAEKIMTRAGVHKSDADVGIPIELVAWWNGLAFTTPMVVHNITRFMNNNLGSSVTSVGNVIHSLLFTSELLTETMCKMTAILCKSSFRGCFGMKCLVNDDRVECVEFNTNPYYLSSMLEVYKGSVVQLLYSIANGGKIDGEFTSDYGVSILASVPPYPSEVKSNILTSVVGLNEKNVKHVYVMDAAYFNNELVCAGSSGKLAFVSARGRDIKEACRRAYKTLSHLGINNIQYRTDVGVDAEWNEGTLFCQTSKFKN